MTESTGGPFWKNILPTKSSTPLPASDTPSLVESIVREAERRTAEDATRETYATPTSSGEEIFEETEHELRAAVRKSTVLLSTTIVVIAMTWLFLYALLDEGNAIYGKVGAKNLTTVMHEKEEISNALTRDMQDMQSFITLIQVEQLAYQILSLELPPATADGAAQFDATKLRTTATQVIEAAGEITNAKLPKNIADALNSVQSSIAAINPAEPNFPAASGSRPAIESAQSAAKKILTTIRSQNLKNLIADFKKQAAGIDVTEADAATRATVAQLQQIITTVSPVRPSSVQEALDASRTLDLTGIHDRVIYRQIAALIGDGVDPASGDLAAATALASNLGKVNIVSELNTRRVVWSSVIDRIEKIARYGSDLTPDATPATDTRKDLNPDASPLFVFSGYSGKEDRGAIELRGDIVGTGAYQAKNFALLADFIDALEASTYFRDVDGFTFAKQKGVDERETTPINLKLTLQDPDVADKRDFVANKEEATFDVSDLPDFNSLKKPNARPTAKATPATTKKADETSQAAETSEAATVPAKAPEKTSAKPATTTPTAE